MGLRRLQVTDFRCLPSADLSFDPRFTLISGANGSGKTSLLEAIYWLGRGRSFRTRKLSRLIRFGQQRCIVFGEVEGARGVLPLGIEATTEGVRARIGGRDAESVAELALHFPVQIIDPEVHKLIEEGPTGRRRFLDWGVFHVEPSYLANWQRYRQALAQRNAALKSRQPGSLVRIWDADLARAGATIDEARKRYVDRLRDVAEQGVKRLLGGSLEIQYRSGWAQDLTLDEALIRSIDLDTQRGATQVGPHRAELVVRTDGVLAREHVSRGQQKLLAAALLIAQLELLRAVHERPTLLLDDPAAELDANRLSRLIEEVARVSPQLIVTTLQPDFPRLGRPGIHWSLQAGACVAER
ncbi:MAG: DNA replication/repair protein RecF [Gammaproteobacteria bacterium]|nr:DNA replication/repair protein RecF [Gammaproteobacteria bacterium]